MPPCAGRRIEVWSTGATLAGWVKDLKDSIKESADYALKGMIPPLSVAGVEWKPGRPLPIEWRPKHTESKKARRKKRRMEKLQHQQDKTGGECAGGTGSSSSSAVHGHTLSLTPGSGALTCPCTCKPERAVRLFAFGMDSARQRIMKQIGSLWCPQHDLFVA